MKGFIEKIKAILAINKEKEERSATWQWCVSYIEKVEINEANLENMAHNSLTHGIFGGTVNEINKEAVRNLAEAFGVVGISNPESEPSGLYPRVFGKNFTESVLLKKIEDTGFRINLPLFIGGRTDLKTEYGIITDRHCHYLWVLKRIMELCPDRNTAIIEIGAGMGILAYYLDKEGYKDYTIIDLAYSNLMQSYFIASNLPERELILSGDAQYPFSLQYKKKIKILHASDFVNVPENRFGLMVNIDGLTEMVMTEAEKYCNSNCAPLLLSINHETNNYRIIEIQKQVKRLVYRYPFWIRKGYVEELYQAV